MIASHQGLGRGRARALQRAKELPAPGVLMMKQHNQSENTKFQPEGAKIETNEVDSSKPQPCHRLFIHGKDKLLITGAGPKLPDAVLEILQKTFHGPVDDQFDGDSSSKSSRYCQLSFGTERLILTGRSSTSLLEHVKNFLLTEKSAKDAISRKLQKLPKIDQETPTDKSIQKNVYSSASDRHQAVDNQNKPALTKSDLDSATVHAPSPDVFNQSKKQDSSRQPPNRLFSKALNSIRETQGNGATRLRTSSKDKLSPSPCTNAVNPFFQTPVDTSSFLIDECTTRPKHGKAGEDKMISATQPATTDTLNVPLPTEADPISQICDSDDKGPGKKAVQTTDPQSSPVTTPYTREFILKLAASPLSHAFPQQVFVEGYIDKDLVIKTSCDEFFNPNTHRLPDATTCIYQRSTDSVQRGLPSSGISRYGNEGIQRNYNNLSRIAHGGFGDGCKVKIV